MSVRASGVLALTSTLLQAKTDTPAEPGAAFCHGGGSRALRSVLLPAMMAALFLPGPVDAARAVRMPDQTVPRGNPVSIPVILDSEGDENALSFSVAFDPALLSFTQGTAGSGAGGASLNVNTSQAASGRVGLIMALGAGQSYAAGTHELVVLSFASTAGATTVTTPVTFADQPLQRIVADAQVNLLTAAFLSATVTLRAGGSYASIVPSAAHAPGKNNTQWRTSLAVANRGASEATITLTYYSYETGSTSVVRTVTLGAGATVEWEDVLVTLFGMSASASNKGSIHIASSVPVLATSRTFNLTLTGTFGQYYPAVSTDEGLANGDVGTVLQIKKSTAFRSNLGVQNLTSAACTASVKLFNGAGAQVGSTLNRSIGGRAYYQWDDVFAKAGAASEPIGYATVEAQTTGCRVWAYGSVVDNVTGDPTTIPVLLQ